MKPLPTFGACHSVGLHIEPMLMKSLPAFGACHSVELVSDWASNVKRISYCLWSPTKIVFWHRDHLIYEWMHEFSTTRNCNGWAVWQATPHRFAVFAYPVTTVRYNATVSLLMDAVMPYGEILLYHWYKIPLILPYHTVKCYLPNLPTRRCQRTSTPLFGLINYQSLVALLETFYLNELKGTKIREHPL